MRACVWVRAHSSVGFYQNRFVSIIIRYLYPRWNSNSCSLPHTHAAYYGGNRHGYKSTPWLCFCWNNCLLHNQHGSTRRAHWSRSGWGQIFSSLRRTVRQRHGDELKTKQSWRSNGASYWPCWWGLRDRQEWRRGRRYRVSPTLLKCLCQNWGNYPQNVLTGLHPATLKRSLRP